MRVFVVLDELDDRRGCQLRAVKLPPKAKDAQVGEVRTLRELVVVEQFVVGFFFDRGLDAVRGAQGVHQLG